MQTKRNQSRDPVFKSTALRKVYKKPMGGGKNQRSTGKEYTAMFLPLNIVKLNGIWSYSQFTPNCRFRPLEECATYVWSPCSSYFPSECISSGGSCIATVSRDNIVGQSSPVLPEQLQEPSMLAKFAGAQVGCSFKFCWASIIEKTKEHQELGSACPSLSLAHTP